MSKATPDEIACPTQGYDNPETVLCFGTYKAGCGNIRDGVAVRLGDDAAPFIIAFRDFERAYLAAKAARAALDGL
jgi:hypothetical protein